MTDERWNKAQDAVVPAHQTSQQLLAGQQGLVAKIEELLFRHDPIGINLGHNTDEYRPEAETITRRLSEATTEHGLQRVIHEEFLHWFAADAGPVERYDSIARETWQLWRTPR